MSDILTAEDAQAQAYQYGFTTAVEAVTLGRGLNESVVRAISAARGEPEFLLKFRLKAFAIFSKMEEPRWAKVDYPPIDLQEIQYFSTTKQKKSEQPTYNSIDEVPQEVLDTFEKLGIPLSEQKRLSGIAVDAVFDSVSVATTCGMPRRTSTADSTPVPTPISKARVCSSIGVAATKSMYSPRTGEKTP